MPLELTISKSVKTAATVPSERVLQAAAMFGLGVDEARELSIIPACVMRIVFPGIVFITGPSGGGKSMILALVETELKAKGVTVMRSADLVRNEDDVDDDRPIVERIGQTLDGAMAVLSRVGLSDAFVMLRRGSELSDGQRARFEMARLIEMAEDAAARGERVAILIDEFAAALDRVTAKTIARNLRKWISRCGELSREICLIVATTHDDLLEPLHPDVLVWKGLGDEIEVVVRGGKAGAA
jgi:uncharacterized protein